MPLLKTLLISHRFSQFPDKFCFILDGNGHVSIIRFPRRRPRVDANTFREARRKYIAAVKRAKYNSWRDFIEDITNVIWKPLQSGKEDNQKEPDESPIIDNSTLPRATAMFQLLGNLFPDDNTADDNGSNTKTHNYVNSQDSTVTALNDIIGTIIQHKQTHLVALLSIVIQAAFANAWHPFVIQSLPTTGTLSAGKRK